MKTKLEGDTFISGMQIMAKVNRNLRHIPLLEFISAFRAWKCRLVECIETGEKCFYTDQSLWLPLFLWPRNIELSHATRLSGAPALFRNFA
jgi:hypothetical protein